MIFKEIEMAGFKSFADRIDVKFDGGITAIVGPNGCGKSNVADAIRWVLGEQSSKTLRGTSMQDIIFNGTEKRKSLSYSEVTLIFNNHDRFFNFDYDELAITRKLYRSGESEYLLNRTSCRLKDIINILYDSGIGKDGYSIIGQGKVQEIIDSKPENRRGMFEEAAGISKFKFRKLESERKLERTRDNLTRLRDIILEIERQLGPLKKQAENAKKFLELKNSLKDLEINAYIYQYENSNDVKDQINVRLRAIIEELNLRQSDFDVASREYNKAMTDVSNFDILLSSMHEKILELTVGLEKQAGETKVIRERINFMKQEGGRLELDLNNSEVLLGTYSKELVKKEASKAEIELRLGELKDSYDELSNSYLKLVDELTISEDEQGESQKKIIDALGSLSDIKSSISKLHVERDLTLDSLDKVKTRTVEIEAKINGLEEQCRQREGRMAELEARIKELKESSGKMSAENFVLENKLADSEQEKQNLATQIQVFENRRRLLSEMQAEYEGYAASVKRILRESERNSTVRSKVIGVLASLIKVPEKYETAIEVALGNAVQNIVTHNENDAKSLINYLKENSYGRATFLPVTSMKRRGIDSSWRGKINSKGVFGVAGDLITYDKNIESVISNLLGATVVVENLDVAVNLAQDTRFSFKIVTLDGDIINPQGSMTGGSKKSEAVNLISREREIETLRKELENKRARLAGINAKFGADKASLYERKEVLNSIISGKNAAEVERAAELERRESIVSILEELKEEFRGLKDENVTLENKIKLINDEFENKHRLEKAINGNQDDVNAVIKERRERFMVLRGQRDDLNANLTAVKVRITADESQIEMVNLEIIRLKNEILKQEVFMADTREALTKNILSIKAAESSIVRQIESAPASKSKLELDELRNKMATIEKEKRNLQSRVQELNADKNRFMENISRLSDRKYKEEMNLAKVDTDIETMQERIYEEYELAYSGCLPLRRPDFNIEAAMPEINSIKKKIAALGYVNVNAIEDSRMLLERYDDLSAQAADLTKAEEDLTKIIKELSAEMISRFDSEFKKINENFGVTFKELFGGGHARLTLTESDNPLEAGVDIVAEPPGKKLLNINLLSGGEKALTAIAILFAILRLKPLPFCLLDEIEAALDEANVQRFAEYLRRFSKETQFIVITHRKPTMELADSLYGVTMEEKGVSKLVSVKLADAVKLDKTEAAG